ncbi:MAG TPA: fumarate/nitrate reduction transcriptional regulator Fnr [Thiolapillus brandeum]|uniref:Fumarate/nitrate reduction transcriptional regulator Fnr n=1 Tax=Thiolapillus brandeum TaxID=1076588 RepID=A0A831RYF7_9GAMM|nr:fumarate/nitrate reduction transcriptional regulator Fnr [Thiolapillus brandeum]
MPQSKVISLNKLKVACKNCGLAKLCLPLGLESGDIDQLDAIVQRNRPLQRGGHVFQTGDRFRSIYVVKTGTIKTYTQCPNGTEQVVGFHLPGEVVGLDGIECSKHICSAKALETTAVCEVPFQHLEELTSTIPDLQHQLFRLMSREITKETGLMVLLGKSTAEERLAAFLLSLSVRFHNRGFSATEFNLSMSRQEIGSYLGLALETVSRLFTHFQDEKILLVDRKHIQILDMDLLYDLLSNQTTCLDKLGAPS